jgi:UDP-3-O-[3-hydroxymyristoyl] glucosamine N-acyltransferase
MSGVMRDIDSMAVMAGIPVIPIKKWHRINSMLSKMISKN